MDIGQLRRRRAKMIDKLMIASGESFCIGAEVVTPGVGVLAYPCCAMHTAQLFCAFNMWTMVHNDAPCTYVHHMYTMVRAFCIGALLFLCTYV